MNFIESTHQTVEKAYDQTDETLRDLIGHEVDAWTEEDIKKQSYQTADIIVTESQRHHNDIFELWCDRALTLWQNDMRRISMDLLNFDDKSKAVKCHDIWPNSMDKWECRELLEELPISDIPYECVRQARTEVERGIAKKMREV